MVWITETRPLAISLLKWTFVGCRMLEKEWWTQLTSNFHQLDQTPNFYYNSKNSPFMQYECKKGHLLHFELAAATRQHVLWITSKCKDHCQSFNLPLAPKNTSRLVTPPGNACIKTISERLPWNPCLSTAAISRRHRHVCICDVGRGRLWFSVSCWPKRSPEIFCNLDSRAAHF